MKNLLYIIVVTTGSGLLMNAQRSAVETIAKKEAPTSQTTPRHGQPQSAVTETQQSFTYTIPAEPEKPGTKAQSTQAEQEKLLRELFEGDDLDEEHDLPSKHR